MKEVFVVYDSKTEVYSEPLYVMGKGAAIRMFSDESNKKDTQMGGHPEDYTLFHLGQYDERKGKFNLFETPISCGVGIEYVKIKEA